MALKWGIASAGLISHDFVTNLGNLSSKDHKVVAVAAKDLKRAKDFAAQHNISTVYTSYADLGKNPEIDIVYVGSINSDHFVISKMALEHGKHVLCEKSLCTNEKDTTTLIKLARQKKLFLMEAIWSRCFPLYKELRKEISDGKIGDVVQLNANFGIFLDAERIKRKELGGGTILDMGVYVLQIVVMIFGKEMPLAVKAVGHVNSNGVDDSAAIVLTYPGSKTAILSTSTLADMENNAYIYGTKGYIKVVDPFWCPLKYVVSAAGKTETLKEMPLPPVGDKRYNFRNSTGLSFEAEEVRQCIKKGLIESPLMTHEESITIAKLQQMINDQLGVKFD